MRIKRVRPQSIRASKAALRRRNIRADEEVMEEDIVDDMPDDAGAGGVDVAPEATDLLFEAEDVAELVAEVTGEEVAVTVDDDAVTFEVGQDVYTVEPEGNEEVLEATRKPLRGKRRVKASRTLRRRRPAKRR